MLHVLDQMSAKIEDQDKTFAKLVILPVPKEEKDVVWCSTGFGLRADTLEHIL